MARFFRRLFFVTFRRNSQFTLAFFWLSGLGAGMLLFRFVGDGLSSLVPLAVSSDVSFSGILWALLIPFLFSAAAVFTGFYKFLYPLSFLVACLFGYMSCGVLTAFGSAGWLLQILLLLGQGLGNTVLLVYWQRYSDGYRRFSPVETACCVLVYFLIASAYCRFISPLLRFYSL